MYAASWLLQTVLLAFWPVAYMALEAISCNPKILIVCHVNWIVRVVVCIIINCVSSYQLLDWKCVTRFVKGSSSHAISNYMNLEYDNLVLINLKISIHLAFLVLKTKFQVNNFFWYEVMSHQSWLIGICVLLFQKFSCTVCCLVDIGARVSLLSVDIWQLRQYCFGINRISGKANGERGVNFHHPNIKYYYCSTCSWSVTVLQWFLTFYKYWMKWCTKYRVCLDP